MEELIFLVKGSSADPYEVTFIKDGSSLTALCTCPAGTYGNFCKHRISILDGITDMIASDNVEQAAIVVSWLKDTDVGTALSEMRQAEKIADPEKKALNAAKRKLARTMNS